MKLISKLTKHQSPLFLTCLLFLLMPLVTTVHAQQNTRLKPLVVRGIKFTGLSGNLLTAQELLEVGVELSSDVAAEGLRLYYAPRADMPSAVVRLKDLGRTKGERAMLDTSAIQEVLKAVSRAFSEKKIGAVRVSITQDAIEHLLAKDTNSILTIQITEGKVGDVNTIGRRPGDKDPMRDDPAHDRIRQGSPVQPGDPMKLQKVNDYLASLNRLPRRHVGLEVRPGTKSGEVNLAYLIEEQKPWLVYAQVDNTGTKTTSRNRQRFGFRHFNLTGDDDILALDYVTGDFDSVHYLSASYDRPFLGMQNVRSKVMGSWSQYQASEVGILDIDFTGEDHQIGLEFSANVLQEGKLFVDMVLGGRYRHSEAENDLTNIRGDADFIVPWFGARLEKTEGYSRVKASLLFEAGWTGEDPDDLERLGRASVEDNWNLLRYSASGSTYVDTGLTDEDEAGETMHAPVHELYGSIRGQQALRGERLPPSFLHPIGGFYSVRGYPESIVSGDSAIVGTAEYRLHAPRLQPPREDPNVSLLGGKLRAYPDMLGRSPQWDLIFRTFFDMGVTKIHDALSYEEGESLAAIGVGVEFSVKENVQLRLDVGMPLNSVRSGTTQVDSGEVRAHFSIGFRY